MEIATATHIGYNERQLPVFDQRSDAVDYKFIPTRSQRRLTKEIRATIELGVFFDAAAYRLFAPHYNNDPEQLRDMILAYMNAVQSLYHHESLGTNIDLVIVYLELMERQPTEMPHHRGERTKLLDEFCVYQSSLNPAGDANAEHWDLGVYISA